MLEVRKEEAYSTKENVRAYLEARAEASWMWTKVPIAAVEGRG
jgi:hypothetical protein